MFGDNTIERRCMTRVKARIASAQKKYNSETEAMDRETEEEHKRLEANLENAKLRLADRLVDEVFSQEPGAKVM